MFFSFFLTFCLLDEIDPTQFSCVFKMELFFRPLLFLLQVGHRPSGLDVSCFLVNLSFDHTYPSGGFSSNAVNCVKLV